MYIQNNYQYNISMTGKGVKNNNWWRRLKQGLLDKVPTKTFNHTEEKIKRIKKTENTISNPAINRVIMGTTALATQPVIDYYNHRVDKETRYVSRNRTIAKVLAGMGVGFLVRGTCYELVKNMTDLQGTGKFSKALIPKLGNYAKKFADDAKKLENYKNALATGLAICIMLFTNFLLDAPLTALLTNKFNAKTAALKKKNEEPERKVLYG